MPIRSIIAVFLVSAIPLRGFAQSNSTKRPTRGGDHFEKRIRPVLAEHCWKCHGTKKQEAGLRLDSRAAVVKGGDAGRIVVVGKPKSSRLLRVLSHRGEIKMPPKRKLDVPTQQAFAHWISEGLQWPNSPAARQASGDAVALNSHWAFQPLRRTAIPAVRSVAWPQTPVDRFLLAKLESAGLSPSNPADKRTLLRRVTFDLTGLPPTPEEADLFLNDKSPNAYEKLVDRLLSSPRYGERWSRFWLDVARYADNKGYVFFEEKTFPWAYTYRDYVVRAFNADLPFDRFVIEQLAADQLDLDDDKRPLTAMGFLTLGGRFMNNTHDVIDDRIDVVTRGLMGITITCARCHDHKFDPISQAEYYALYGVFRGSIEPLLQPTFQPIPNSAAAKKFDAEMRKRLKALNDYVTRKRNELITDGRKRAAEYLLEAYAKRNQPATDDFMLLVPTGGLNPTMVQRWQKHLARAKRDADPVWAIWHWYSAIPDEQFGKLAAGINNRIAAIDPRRTKLNRLVVRAFQKTPPKTMRGVAAVYARLLQTTKTSNNAKPNRDESQLLANFHGEDAPPVVPRLLGYGFLSLLPDRKAQGEYKKLLKAVEQWSMKGPAAPPRAMVLRDAPHRYQPRLFLRGNPSRLGKPVSRVLPRVLNRRSPTLKTGSGRLELARAIVDPGNSLTARVIVNRIWRHHFGQGLVTTPSDFGTRSRPPSHPKLLDWLSRKLMSRPSDRGGFGWSIKRLHREIVLSAAYRQQSVDRADCRANDPTNRLLWRMNRRRLNFEATRDSLLAVAGVLDQRLGGKPVNLLRAGFNTRRTIYGFIDRMNLPNLHRAFDFPSPAATSPKRDATTIPPQALYLMNHEFVRQAAKRLSEQTRGLQAEARIRRMYDVLFNRRPSNMELRIATRFLGRTNIEPQSLRLAHALLMTNEFVFID